MSLELMFNAVNLNLIAFSYQLGDLAGQIFAIFVITIAAGEAAIGLGIIIALCPPPGHDRTSTRPARCRS